MADPFGGLPPELFAEYQELQRRQKMTDLLMQQSQQPIEPPVVKGRFSVPISPFQGAAKMLQAYNAGQSQDANTKAYAGLGQRYQNKITDALMQKDRIATGTPGTPDIAPLTPNDDEGNPMPVAAGMAAVAGNKRKAMEFALSNPYLKNEPRFKAEYEHYLKSQDPINAGPGHRILAPDENGNLVSRYTVPPNPVRVPAFKVGDTRQIRDERNILTQEYQADGTWKQIGKGDADKPASTTIHNPAPVTMQVFKDDTSRTGWSARDARGGSMVIKDVPAPSVSAEREDIKNAGAQKRATQADQRSALNALKAAGYDPVTGRDGVEDLIKKSTSGFMQKMGAEGLAFVNISTSGREALNTLTAAANKITLELMDRKLGAGISNADRDFIVNQLGDISNANKTSDERLAAWRYAKSRMIDLGMLPTSGAKPITPADVPAAPGAAPTIRFDAQGNRLP